MNSITQVRPPAPSGHLHRRRLRGLFVVPGTLLPAPLPEHVVAQVADPCVAVLRGRGDDPIPLAFNGHPLAEG